MPTKNLGSSHPVGAARGWMWPQVCLFLGWRRKFLLRLEDQPINGILLPIGKLRVQPSVFSTADIPGRLDSQNLMSE
jgi:hypothetical protein